MRLIMNAGHAYEIYGKAVRAGDEFEVPDHEGETWIKMGRARLKTEHQEKRRYNRRDMRAEDE